MDEQFAEMHKRERAALVEAMNNLPPAQSWMALPPGTVVECAKPLLDLKNMAIGKIERDIQNQVAIRSRDMKGGQLEPPADVPTLFTCRYRGAESIGCVYRNGVVTVIPDRCSYEAGPCCFNSLGTVEGSAEVTDIVWEWAIYRVKP